MLIFKKLLLLTLDVLALCGGIQTFTLQSAGSRVRALGLRKTEGRRGRQRMRWTDGITDSLDIEFEQSPGDKEGQGSPACCRVGHDLVTEQQ